MEIAARERVYEKVDEDNFLEWTLVATKVNLTVVKKKQADLTEATIDIPKAVEYPKEPTVDQISAIDAYNVAILGPYEEKISELNKVEKIITAIGNSSGE
jgi:hypothetical protein